jgi:hypothetical protein
VTPIFGLGVVREVFGLESWMKRRMRPRTMVAIARGMMEREKLNRILGAGFV